jgi:indolepyruvate ferredoxin oxidoreductase alpha subunit
MILLDPRPNLEKMVELVEHGFAISECSNMPTMMELRIRACHVKGSFKTKKNKPSNISQLSKLDAPAEFNYNKLAHPPVTFPQEKLKHEKRIPAARQYILDNELNEIFDGSISKFGFIVQGGLYNTLIRTLQQFGLTDEFGNTQIPILVLNVTSPLVPQQILEFCENKESVLLFEEGQPEYIEQEISTFLRRGNSSTVLHGKDLLPMGGEYNAEAMIKAVLAFCNSYLPNNVHLDSVNKYLEDLSCRRELAKKMLPVGHHILPPRPPGFCIGCPERPVFSAIKLAQQAMGPAMHWEPLSHFQLDTPYWATG